MRTDKESLAPLLGHYPCPAKFWADAGYQGPFPGRVQATLEWEVESVRRPLILGRSSALFGACILVRLSHALLGI